MKTQCIYCKKAGSSKEHAFPESLLHKCAPLGKYAPNWIIRQVCQGCNSALGKLDEILATRSAMAAIWIRIKNEWDPGVERQDSALYNTKAQGIDPVLLIYPDPLYENFMVLHEEIGISMSGFYPTPVVRALAPQIILILYAEGQTVEQIVTKNYEQWDANELLPAESDEHKGVYCISGNTYIFPPKATRCFISNSDKVQEFKSKFLKKRDNVRYDLYFLSSDNREDSRKLKAFYEQLASTGTQEQTEAEHFEPKEFPQKIMAVADPKARPYIDRAIAKTAFHSFLYHNRQFGGHEPIFNDIKAFIEGKADSREETGKEFVAGLQVTEDYIRDSNEHFHLLRFYINGDNIVCQIAFFTGLLVGPFASAVTLAGDYDKATQDSFKQVSIPFYVHAKSELMRRIVPVSFDR